MARAPKISADERRWRAEDDLRTLTRAQEIQKDRSRMSQVQKIAQQQVKTLSAVVQPAARKSPARKK